MYVASKTLNCYKYLLFILITLVFGCSNGHQETVTIESLKIDTLIDSPLKIDSFAIDLYRKSDFNQSLKYSKIALSKTDKLNDSIIIMTRQIPIFRKLEKYDVVDSLFSVLELKFDSTKLTSLEYADFCYKRAEYLRFKSDYKGALNSVQTAIKIHKDSLGFYNGALADDFNNQAICQEMLGNLEGALLTYNKSIEIADSIRGKASTTYINPLFNRSMVLFRLGNVEEAIKVGEETLALRKEVLVPYHEHILSNLYTLGFMNYQQDNIEPSMYYYKNGLDLMKTHSVSDSRSYINFTRGLGINYESLGDYDRSLRYYEEALSTAESAYGKDDFFCSFIKNSIGINYIMSGKNEKAVQLYKNLLPKFISRFGENNVETINLQLNLTKAYSRTKQFAQSDSLLNVIYSGDYCKKNPIYYSGVLVTDATNKISSGKYKEAIKLLTQAIEIRKPTLGSNHRNTINAEYILAKALSKVSENKKANNLFNSVIQKDLNQLSHYYSYFTEEEYLNFIDKVNSHLQYYYNHIYNNSINLNYQNSLIDICLNFKGSAYDQNKSASISKISSKVQNSETYKNWVAARENYNSNYLKNEQSSILNNLKDSILILESQLWNAASNNNPKKATISKQDIFDKLENNELFVDYYATEIPSESDSLSNIKLLYPIVYDKKHMLCKILDPINATGLENIIADNPKNYHNDILSKLILTSLDSFLTTDIQNIHISPDGVLRNISFDALTRNNKFLIEQVNVYHHHNAREFVSSQLKKPIQGFKASLFGGSNFDFVDKTQEFEQNNNEQLIYASINDESSSLNLRSNNLKKLDYLPGSKKEVEEIKIILKSNGFKGSTFLDDLSSKENVLDQFNENNDVNIIHIATHGHFSKVADHSNPYLSSWLFFSGANNCLESDYYYTSGILTAYEINNRHLKNCELVVLSSCFSAKGDLFYSQAKIGLPRAFKNAGARYVISTLYEIPDKPTLEFMTTFYKELVTTKNVHRALRDTKLKFKEKYSDRFWSAFVVT